MQYSREEALFAASYEGYSPVAVHHPEDPPDVWTLGYGSTYWWDDGAVIPKRVRPGMRTTTDEALKQLGCGLRAAATTVNVSVSFVLTQHEFNACTDLVYNIGPSRWIHSTVRTDLNEGKVVDAALAFEMWRFAGGKELAGLLRRRIAEEQMFNTPDTLNATT